MTAPTQSTCLRRQLTALGLYAAMPFLIALGPAGVKPDAAVDWLRLLPVFAPTIGGYVLTGCLMLYFLPAVETRAGRIAWCTGWAFASPLAATAFAFLLFAVLSMASLGRLADTGSLQWVVTILPMLMYEAPIVYALGALALAAATAGMLSDFADNAAEPRGTTTITR